nr:hypothetical protein CFP56_11569 [Quercus suber]
MIVISGSGGPSTVSLRWKAGGQRGMSQSPADHQTCSQSCAVISSRWSSATAMSRSRPREEWTTAQARRSSGAHISRGLSPSLAQGQVGCGTKEDRGLRIRTPAPFRHSATGTASEAFGDLHDRVPVHAPLAGLYSLLCNTVLQAAPAALEESALLKFAHSNKMSAPTGWMQTIQGHAANLNANWQSYLLQQHHHRINKEIGKQLTADELQAHPEYPHVNWDLTAERKGRVEVAKGRGGPLKISYEVHGRGSKKLVVSPLRPWATFIFTVTPAPKRHEACPTFAAATG